MDISEKRLDAPPPTSESLSQESLGMKIAILGATGQTGQEAVAQALQKGYRVTAVVRTPDKLKVKDPKLQVVVGDVMDKESLTLLLAGHEAVISCLGFSRTSRVTGYTDSMKAIVEAMRNTNIRKLVVMTSWYTDVTQASQGGFFCELDPSADHQACADQLVRNGGLLETGVLGHRLHCGTTPRSRYWCPHRQDRVGYGGRLLR